LWWHSLHTFTSCILYILFYNFFLHKCYNLILLLLTQSSLSVYCSKKYNHGMIDHTKQWKIFLIFFILQSEKSYNPAQLLESSCILMIIHCYFNFLTKCTTRKLKSLYRSWINNQKDQFQHNKRLSSVFPRYLIVRWPMEESNITYKKSLERKSEEK